MKNSISFTHPEQLPRKLQFERQGRKGMYATRGVWGEKDWFETLRPDAEAYLPVLKAKVIEYRQAGFSLSRTNISDRRFAEALELPLAIKRAPKRPKKPGSAHFEIATTKKKAALSKILPSRRKA